MQRTNPETLNYLINYGLNRVDSIALLNEQFNSLLKDLSPSNSNIYFSQRDRLHTIYQTKQISKNLYLQIYNYLHKAEFEYDLLIDEEKNALFELGLSGLAGLYHSTDQIEFPICLNKFLKIELAQVAETESLYWSETRANIISLNEEFLEISIEEKGLKIIKVPVNKLDKLSLVQIQKMIKIYPSAIPIYVHEVRLEANQWLLGSIVLFPDYLIDVTAIAECYDPKYNSVIRQFINLYEERLSSKSILIGTAVNEFLDELIINEDSPYKELLKKVFHKYALGLTALNTEDAVQFFSSTEQQFNNLKKTVKSRFNGKVDHLEECLLEPSFFSVKYGIQGRLDVLVNLSNELKLIIELKSGKPYNVNSEGINPSHHAQACLYSLLLESVYGTQIKHEAYILYSVLEKDNIRSAIDQKSLRRRLLEIRNSIVLIHFHLSFTSPDSKTMLDIITPQIFEQSNNFTKRDGFNWLNTYTALEEVEKTYIKYYSYFISREQLISKCGIHGNNQYQGLASMWLLSNYEKDNHFTILSNLQIQEIQNNKQDTPVILLKTKTGENPISQFRIGDTLILYPQTEDGKGMLQSLVFKCTMIQIDGTYYHVRLRGRQFSSEDQILHTTWCLENDNMDKPFMHQFSNLFEFARANPTYRRKILGIDPPAKTNQVQDSGEANSNNLINRIIESKDYFLLWGPPGSGKTSMIIKKLIERLYFSTEQSILLLAYTNRAVDEICEVLESFETALNYIRIGSRYGTKPAYQDKLFDFKVSTLNTRQQLIDLLDKTRIFTGTIASIQGKKELFQLKNFDILIIDEASQILEPNLVGLLSRFKKFILIGDHLQLPAVSAQAEDTCLIQNEKLNIFNFEKLNDSLFERLFRQCKMNNWTHAYEMLRKQGRMHKELMFFPSKYFYESQLELMDENLESRQYKILSDKFLHVDPNPLNQILTKERTLFISSEGLELSSISKSNPEEADLVVKVLAELYMLYKNNDLVWDHNTCGIITPYRVQISTISSKILQTQLDHIPITIDTVERYQGSARDIIILSTCVKSVSQLEQISSLNKEGIDRKLNVALTRAREQIIVIGNKKVLSNSLIYSKLIEEYTEYNLLEESSSKIN